MGAEQALLSRGASYGVLGLNSFVDEILAEVVIEGGNWILMGRARIENHDGDAQEASVSLVWAGKRLDHLPLRLDAATNWRTTPSAACFYVQTVFEAEDEEHILLQGNTYKGAASNGSLIAVKVDNIKFQDI